MNNLSTEKHISVLIPDGENNFALPVLRCLGQMQNVKTHVLSNDPLALIRFSRYRNQFFSYSKGKNEEEQLSVINDTIKKAKVDVILPVGEEIIRLISVHRMELSKLTALPPLPEADTFDMSKNKWLLSKWLNKNQIPCPSTILYKAGIEFEEALLKIPFPVLLKPTQNANGAGIEFFDNPLALISFCNKHISSEEFIVQSYINGYDIDCSVLCLDGKILAHTIQRGYIFGPKRFAPAIGIELAYNKGVYDVVKELIEKLNWSGITHIDLRYDEQDKQVKIIEMNNRYFGSILGSLSAGVNFPYLACLSGLNLKYPQFEFKPKRFVFGSLALKMFVQQFFHRNRDDIYSNDSIFRYILKDPLPWIINAWFKIYKKLFNNK